MSNTALLVIDSQVGIIEGPTDGPVYNKEEVLKVMVQVIEKARALGLPVIYVQDLGVGEKGSEQQNIHPAIAPLPGDPVVQKIATNSFLQTNLQETLDTYGIGHIVIIGAKTQYCIDTACRAATALGYDVTLVADAHSTTDSKVLSAAQMIAHHNQTLHGFDNIDHFVLVRNSAENIFEHKHLEYK
ncbi:isochorismatase [Paenibacillus faecis]|uniref:cysteine hydrolase family protein n=1 Tax=Paenibacillus faecis TaxID=862114 RepID=UPI001B04F58B|nr:cysteine hydrolase family protein [Paenibacillus faecis]GIO88673.1 isochorismatase [Paenibacillus faecis]